MTILAREPEEGVIGDTGAWLTPKRGGRRSSHQREQIEKRCGGGSSVFEALGKAPYACMGQRGEEESKIRLEGGLGLDGEGA